MARLKLKETMERLLLYIRSGYPVIYVVSHEEYRVLDYLAKIVRMIRAENPNKNLCTWYEGLGLRRLKNLANNPAEGEIEWLNLEGMPAEEEKWDSKEMTAEIALATIVGAKESGDAFLADSLTVFFDLHPYLQVNSFVQTGSLVRPLRNTADKLRRQYDKSRTIDDKSYQTIVVVAPTASRLSMELERDICIIDFPLPEHDELLMTLKNMTDEKKPLLKFPSKISEKEAEKVGGNDTSDEIYRNRLSDLIAGSGRGLTLEDYKRGLNMFAVKDSSRELSSKHIEDMLDLKEKAINNEALQYTPHVEINLGGLDSVKEWIRIRREPTVSKSVREMYHLTSSKGVMLCGVSGGGKSQLAKLIAKEFNLALLRLDVGALFGSYVGESEERTRRALMLAEVLAPIVLWLDEIDKAFSGISGGGDNGVSSRVFGHFLTWLAEKQDNVFVVATANDFRTLLEKFPEFGRKGRFDEIFWVGLPSVGARKEIFRIYLEPHFNSVDQFKQRIFEINNNNLNQCITDEHIAGQPSDKDVLGKFCWLLSQDRISGQMTGAEIEYAITESLYQAYKIDIEQPRVNQGKFTPALVVDTVKKARERCLGVGGSKTIEELQKKAKENHWIFAE